MVKVDTASLDEARGLSRFMKQGTTGGITTQNMNQEGGTSSAAMGSNPTTMMRSDGMNHKGDSASHTQ